MLLTSSQCEQLLSGFEAFDLASHTLNMFRSDVVTPLTTFFCAFCGFFLFAMLLLAVVAKQSHH